MSVDCPFSPKSVNENVVRLTAGLIVILLLASLFSMHPWISLFLCFDFFIRGFTDRPFSPVLRAAKALSKILRLQPHMINAGPKIFAARMGCVFCGIISALSFIGLTTPAHLLTELLVLMAGLEAFLKICVGCHIYSLMHSLKKSFQSKNK